MDNVSVDLETFLDRHECTLPRTVKIMDGFRGYTDEDTLTTDQIFVFYKVERQKVIMALDEFGQEICVQQNSNFKVYLLPLEFFTYNTVQDLLSAPFTCILVLEDILSAGIVSGSKLKLLRDQRSFPSYLKCQVIDQDDSRLVLLPLHLTGKFLPLLDFKDYSLDEVLSQNRLPISVRFISQSTRASDCVTGRSLTNLGSIRLTQKTEVGMAFAASFENELSLYMFPKTLDITVSKGFKVSAETSKNIKECRKALETHEASLKRLDHVVKGSFYFTASPVRRFGLQSLQKTSPIPLPRALRAKHDKIPKGKLNAKNEMSTKRATTPLASTERQQRVPSLSISGEFEDDGDYENCETGEMSRLFTDSGPPEVNACLAAPDTSNEGIYRNSEALALPLNRMSSLSERSKVKEAKPHGTSRPVPRPRKRLVLNAGCQETCKDSQIVQTQWQGGKIVEITDSALQPGTPSTETDVDEICPELPLRPLFLQPLSIGNDKEENLTSQEDNPPPLPPKNGKKTFPEQQRHAENKDKEETITRSETPAPALPPKYKSFSLNHLGLAYLVVDVSDWKAVEENYFGAYAEVKDDGRVFKQDGGRNSYLEVIYQADDTEDNPVRNGQKPEEKTRLQTDCENTDILRFSGAGIDNKESKQVEEVSSEYLKPCDEVNDSYQSSQREFRLETNTKSQKKATVIKLSENSSSSHSTECSAHSSSQKGSSVSRPRSNNSNIWISARREEDCKDGEDHVVMKGQKSKAKTSHESIKRLLSEGSSEDDEPYEEINYSYENSQTECPLEMSTDNQNKFGLKMPTKHSSSSNRSSQNAHCSTQTSIQNGTSGASRPRTNNNTICMISARREEDFMDFKDIEQFLKLRKQLNDTRAQVKNLEKKVALKEQYPTEGKRILLKTKDEMTSSCTASNSQRLDKKSKDKNMKKLDKKEANLTSIGTENSVPGKAGLIIQESEVSKPTLSENCDDDDDAYEECYDRKYVNQGIVVQNNSVYYVNVDKNEQSNSDRDDEGIEPIYYNTVEIETMSDRTSRYLQLGNSSEKGENVHFNADDQNSDGDDVEQTSVGTKEMANDLSKSEKKRS